MKTLLKTQIEISEELKKEIIEKIEKTKVKIYWDYRDTPDEKRCLEIGFNAYCDEIFEMNIDYIGDLEHEAKNEILKEYAEKIDVAIEELEEIFDGYYPCVDMNLKQLFRNSYALVNLVLYSNYDCINSHWFEGQGGYYYKESYFGDMVDALNLNPAKVKKLLVEKGVKVCGEYPNKKNRNEKEFVSYSDFWVELQNTCCGANLLTIPVKIPLYEFDEKNIKELLIPKNSHIGLFSSMQGGGSIIEMNLLKDMKIKLEVKNYSGWAIDNSGYSIKDVYGVTDDFFNEI